MKEKRGQVTIFIILAILIVAVIIIVFFPTVRDSVKALVTGPAPLGDIRKCMEDSSREVLDILSKQGGSLEPEHYFLYKGDKIDYVCYTGEYYKTCVMQKPFLKNDFEREVKEYIEPTVKNCFLDVRDDLVGRGYNVDARFGGVDVILVPGSMIITTNTSLIITKDSTEEYKNIKTDIESGLHDLLMIATSISNWEARYGDSDPMTYMGYYPNLKVEKKSQGDGTKVYILTDRTSGESFQFASRSLVFPPGYLGL